MKRQRGQRLAMGGDAVTGIERAQLHQKRARLGQRRGGRRGEEGQVAAVAAPESKFERQPRQIGGGDFGRREGGHAAFFALRPQPVAKPPGHPAGPAAALLGLGPGDAFGHQPRHAGTGVEAGPPRPAAVDDDADALDRQRGFGDGRGQHDLAARGNRRDGGALIGEGHGAEERAQDATGGQITGEQRLHPPDFGFAGQEHQNAAVTIAGRVADEMGDGGRVAQAGIRAARQPAGFHRIGAAPRGDDGRAVEHRGNRFGVERCRHHQDLQVGAQRLACLPGQGKAKIGVERAFVKFVEDHRADPRQIRGRLQHPGQDTFGDDLDPGGLRDPGLAAYPVADGMPDRLAQSIGHAFGGGAGGEAARLQHDDAAPGGGGGRFKQRQRDARGLARARRSLQYRAAAAGQRLDQRRERVFDGQSVGHAGGYRRFSRPLP